MNKKSLLGLILFACLITTGLFASANFLINQENKTGADVGQSLSTKEDATKDTTEAADAEDDSKEDEILAIGDGKVDDEAEGLDNVTEEPWLSANPTDTGTAIDETTELKEGENAEEAPTSSGDADNTFSSSINTVTAPQLILDCNEVDYEEHIPEMVYDSKIEIALDISNPSISVDATAAILFDADTKEVLYHKNPVQAVFPASTAKLLTSLVALELCKEDEEVTIGEEIKMIASDSTRAYLKKGEILTIRNLLEGMLLPSGNDAAYAIAAYVGKSHYKCQIPRRKRQCWSL